MADLSGVDQTLSVCRALGARLEPHPQTPFNWEWCLEALRSDLVHPIPIFGLAAALLQVSSGGPDVRFHPINRSFIEGSAIDNLTILYSETRNFLCNPIFNFAETSMDSELGVQHLHVNFQETLFRLFDRHNNCQFQFHQNVTQQLDVSVTRPGLRPDKFVSTRRGVMLFKNEQKAADSQLEAAVLELTSKMAVWNPLVMGKINVILCMATAGHSVQFSVMSPDRVAHVVCFPEYDDGVINVRHTAGRLVFIRTLINCFRIMNALKDAAPALGARGLYTTEEREMSGCTITFYSDYVEKIYSLARSGGPAFELRRLTTLQGLYGDLSCSECQQLERPLSVPRLHNTRLKVNVIPVGYNIEPSNERELRDAMRCVLLGLQELHGLGWAHCDVRWPNVLKTVDANWVLIDYDNARRLPEDATERATATRADLHMAIRLTSTLSAPMALTAQCCAFLMRLEQHSTVTAQLLNDSWF